MPSSSRWQTWYGDHPNVGNGWILLIIFRSQWHKGSEPIHQMAILVQAIPTQEVCAQPAQFPHCHWHHWPRMPAIRALLPFLSSQSMHRLAFRVAILHLLHCPGKMDVIKHLNEAILWVESGIHLCGGTEVAPGFLDSGMGLLHQVNSSHFAVMSKPTMDSCC